MDMVMPVDSSATGLMRQLSGRIPKGLRVYQVISEEVGPVYTLSNSPGQAALRVVSVRRLTDREIMQAALEALGVK